VRTRLLCAALALVSLPALAGCGGASGNGVASKSPTEILAAAQTAASGAKSVHLAGSVVTGRAPLSLDLALVAGKGARGEIAQRGLPFQLIALDGAVYVYGSEAFYRHFGGNAALQLFRGRWLKAPANSGEFASLAPLTEMQALLGTLLRSHGKLEPAGAAVIDGQKTVGVRDASHGGTLYVATSGKPYPVAVLESGAGGGRVVFDRWNQPVSIAAPPDAVDIAALQRT
jgi:hypothetical protein